MKPGAIIFTHSVTPRLEYITDFLSSYYGIPFQLTPDENTYQQAEIPCRINYSFHRLNDDEIFIHAHALLFESAVRPVKVECFTHNGYKAFFRVEGDTGFDLFAAVFFCLSRYEEYLPHKVDQYGRYAHTESVAFREEFLQVPLVNIWLEDFRGMLAARNPEFSQQNRSFTFRPTYDIDMAWSFRGKGIKRNAGALLKLLLTARFGQALHRIRVLQGKKPDPFDAYEWMNALHRKYGLKPLYFFLVSQHSSRYDRNTDPRDPSFQQLVRSIAADYEAGLHPSWQSGDVVHLLPQEKKYLEHISGKAITASRQHYIRLDLPATYRHLLDVGITDDYSMGYGSINGFRASIASSFSWYDLRHDAPTGLRIHPFCFMDANAWYEQKQDPSQALEALLRYAAAIREVNGEMITIWHNSFLGNHGEFAGWQDVYERFIAAVAT